MPSSGVSEDNCSVLLQKKKKKKKKKKERKKERKNPDPKTDVQIPTPAFSQITIW
jgi:hypothetical protein